MTIEKITYSESVEAINASGNKIWFKSGIEIANVDNEDTKATKIAKEYVTETIKKTLEENPTYIPDPATYHSETKFTKATDLVKKDKNKEQEEAALIGEMFSCKDLDTLKTYEVASNSNGVSKAVTETYNMMFKKLSK